MVLIICALLLDGKGGRAQEPPATLRILSPADGATVTSSQVTIRVAVRAAPGSEVRRVAALLGSREIAQSRGIGIVQTSPTDAQLSPGESLYSLSVTVPAADSVILLRAETTTGDSEPVPLRLRWEGETSAAFTVPPRLYVLSVGVTQYERTDLRLTYPAKDAQDVAAAFARQNGLLYREVITRVLIDKGATKAAILDGLEWIQRQTTVRDVAVVFLAGHGINDPSTGRYHFLPVDAELASIKRTMLSQEELQGSLRSIAGKVLFFLDTCHSGNLLGEWASRGIEDLAPFISELSSSDGGVVVFAASTGRQTSKESPSWGNGAFTKALIEGLSGGASFVSGRPISVNMLELYISERVKELTAGIQTPATGKPSSLPDFPIAMTPQDGAPTPAPLLSTPPPLKNKSRRALILGVTLGTSAAVLLGAGLGLYFGLRPPPTTLGVIEPMFN